MFINKLNQLYKPQRVLYYIEPSEEELASFYQGYCPESVEKYTNAFGTYDVPGLFYVKKLGQSIIGIEFRKDDDRISYPNDLKSVVLDDEFFYSIETDNDIDLSLESIKTLFDGIADDDDAHRQFSDLKVNKDPAVIGVFITAKKVRILYDLLLDCDRARTVIFDEKDKLDREDLYRKAFFDPITGHPNWNHLVPFLEMPMDIGIKDYAFAHFDIKSFKAINEIYGHIAANKVLTNVVRAMNEADFVYASARCHNDNFAMMLKDMPEEEMTRKLEEFFEGISYLEEDPNYKIHYRCGLVPMQRAILSGNRVADAGKLAQSLGTHPSKTQIVTYTEKMHQDILWSNSIKAYVETAIENDEFIVYLQPKFDIRTEKVKGAEALVRWNYKKREFLPPSRFIPFFEKDGSIGRVDDIVLRKVCESFAKWKKEGRPLYPISVNLSRSRLYNPSLTRHLARIVDSYGVSHELIDFELTESASYDDTEQMISVLEELNSMGFKISMDDFGTGYSSFSLLTEMPLDTLKIDKSFVDKLAVPNERKGDVIVLSHIISLSKQLEFVCLAEGAETQQQVERLRELGCEVVQGYYYSKPVPLAQYEEKYL